MNLENEQLRDLIEYASDNCYAVYIISDICSVEFTDDFGNGLFYVCLSVVSNGICINKYLYDSTDNPVQISIAEFKRLIDK